MRLTHGQATFGGFAVMGFFVISGFLIAGSRDKSKSFWGYLIRRVKRIYPGYIVAFLTGFYIFGAITSSDPNYWASFGHMGIWKYALMLKTYDPSGVFPTNPMPGIVNGSLWTIRFEFWCYLLVAGLASVGILTKRVVSLGLLIAATVATAFARGPEFWHEMPNPIGGHWPQLLMAFLAGVAFYAWRESIPWSKALFWGCAALYVGSCAFGGYSIIGHLTMAYIVMFLGYAPSPMNGWFKQVDISYGVYLYAFPIQQSLVYFYGVRNPWALFLLSMPLIVGAGLLSYFLIEKPFLPKGRVRRSRMSEGGEGEPLTSTSSEAPKPAEA